MWFSKNGTELNLYVKVSPGAKQTSIVGVLPLGKPHLLKISVAAQPVNHGANKALLIYLADLAKLPLKNFSIVRGQTAGKKLIKVAGESGLLISNIQHILEKKSEQTPELPLL